MAITDCTICGKMLDGTIIPDGCGFAHSGCYVARQFRMRQPFALAHGDTCGECPSCEEGHPERCRGGGK